MRFAHGDRGHPWHPTCLSLTKMMPLRRKKARLLIVDPDADVRDALVNFLTEAFEVDSAGSAREALSLLEAHPVDVVVAEAELPDHYAPGFLLEVRRRLPRVVLVATYQYGDQAQVAEPLFRRIADLVVSKPFDILKLEDTLLALVESKGHFEQEGA